VYNKTPDYTREGGSIPVTLTFTKSLGVNVLLASMGRADDGAQYVVVILPTRFPLVFSSTCSARQVEVGSF
jgi:hypothetical protein